MTTAVLSPLQLCIPTMAPSHSRRSSDDTTQSSMSFLLEHVLQYPGCHDIPLRTMHQLNRQALLLPLDLSRTHTPTGCKQAESAATSFTAPLASQLKGLPTRPSSLPPPFIVSFVSRCFPPVLADVDFHQALTALDYLNSLEARRRKETLAALDRLHIRKETYGSDMAFMADKFPGIALWVGNVQGKNEKAEQHYAQLWLGLRRWIMINLLSEPFNKLNCLSMLNTLLPPVHDETKLPSLLSSRTIKEERDLFFRLTRDVQRTGPSLLHPYLDAAKDDNEANGWPAVQRGLDKYLRVAENMIKDCMATTGPDSFTTYLTHEQSKEKKHDSGVSFGSQRRPSCGSSRHEQPGLEPAVASYASSFKGPGKLERITREFKRMRVKPRPEIEEISHINQRPGMEERSHTNQRTPSDTPAPNGARAEHKSLKKARSLASLKFRNNSSLSVASRNFSEVVPFKPKQLNKYRVMYESSIKSGKSGQN